MTPQTSRLDKAFLDRQKRRLTDLRQQILRVRRGEEGEEASANAETHDQAREFEDDAQNLTPLGPEGNLEAAEEDRSARVGSGSAVHAGGTRIARLSALTFLKE